MEQGELEAAKRESCPLCLPGRGTRGHLTVATAMLPFLVTARQTFISPPVSILMNYPLAHSYNNKDAGSTVWCLVRFIVSSTPIRSTQLVPRKFTAL